MLELILPGCIAILALFLARMGRATRFGKFLSLFMLILFLLQTGVHVASHVVGGTGFNEAVYYHLIYGLEGAGIGQFRLAIIRTAGALGIILFVIWFILFSAVFERIFARIFPSVSHFKRSLRTLGLLLSTCAVIGHPLVFDAWETFFPSGTVAPMLDAYVSPDKLKLPQKPPNLVILYLESMERTYFDEKVFPGVAPHLRNWESKSLAFTNIRQTYGTGWTIAGMVASQCGLPLVPKDVDISLVEVQDRARNNHRGSLFLPGATCLGDLLKDAGYHLVYMGGASNAFAGKANFYRTHGFAETFGKQELLPRVGTGKHGSWWGLYDEALFPLVTDKFVELYTADKPFALVALTLDTHAGDGMPYSPSCTDFPPVAKENQNLRAVHCADTLANNLIEKIRVLDTRRNTYVVVLSDHLAMQNSAIEMLKALNRRNLFFINAPDGSLRGVNSRPASTLSNGVTALDALGFDIGALGLGRSLLRSPRTLEESLGEDFYRSLQSWAPELQKFWRFSRLNQSRSAD